MALSACAATDVRSPESVAVSSDTVSQVARLTVFRAAESAQYPGGSANLSIDGKEMGAIESAGFTTFDVPAGSHVLIAGVSSSPETCKLQIEVVGGAAYYYEVVTRTATPRTPNFARTLPGAIVGALGVIGALVSGVAGIVGILAESPEFNRVCAIVSMEENMALPTLDSLRKPK
jgi:hypothetical protein